MSPQFYCFQASRPNGKAQGENFFNILFLFFKILLYTSRRMQACRPSSTAFRRVAQTGKHKEKISLTFYFYFLRFCFIPLVECRRVAPVLLLSGESPKRESTRRVYYYITHFLCKNFEYAVLRSSGGFSMKTVQNRQHSRMTILFILVLLTFIIHPKTNRSYNRKMIITGYSSTEEGHCSG